MNRTPNDNNLDTKSRFTSIASLIESGDASDLSELRQDSIKLLATVESLNSQVHTLTGALLEQQLFKKQITGLLSEAGITPNRNQDQVAQIKTILAANKRSD